MPPVGRGIHLRSRSLVHSRVFCSRDLVVRPCVSHSIVPVDGRCRVPSVARSSGGGGAVSAYHRSTALSANHNTVSFILEPPISDSPLLRNVRILQGSDSTDYWIPIKHRQLSLDDIVFDPVYKERVIEMPQHAASSFTREDMKRHSRRVHFHRDRITCHESRRLPSHLFVGSTDFVTDIEDHLPPSQVSPAGGRDLEMSAPKSPSRGAREKTLGEDFVMLCSSVGGKEGEETEHEKRARQLSLAAGHISAEINQIGHPDNTDFSVYDHSYTVFYRSAKLRRHRVCGSLSSYKRLSFLVNFLCAYKHQAEGHVLKMEQHPEKGVVCIRWKIRTLSLLASFFNSLGARMRTGGGGGGASALDSYKNYDFYSEFHMNDNGKIFLHEASKILPNREESSVLKKMTVAAAALFCPLPGDSFVKRIEEEDK